MFHDARSLPAGTVLDAEICIVGADSRHLGVVDAGCRVHGVANLYIAGSSVFASAGFTNPTLTVVALARRLADELVRELG